MLSHCYQSARQCNPARAQLHAHSGFSLVELMVTMGIMVILVMVAIPEMMTPLADMRLRTLASEFADSISLSRSEARRRRVVVAMCPRAASGGCDADASNWDHGWVIYEDRNSDCAYTQGEAVIRVRNALEPRVTLVESVTASLCFDAVGSTIGLTNGPRTLRIVDVPSTVSRYLVVGRVGAPQVLASAP